MKKKSTKKAEKTRRFIVKKAAPLFNKKGYAGTSISDLTQACGLSKGSIYGNFKNKDELAVEVFRYNVEWLFSFFEKELSAARSPYEKLLSYPRSFRKLFSAMCEYGGCPIINTAVEADDTHPALLKEVLSVIGKWESELASLISESIKEKEISPDIDCHIAARRILIIIEGGSVLAKVTGEMAYLHEAVDAVENFISGMRRLA